MSRPEPIPALTGLRIIGAAWVVLFHFQHTLYEASGALRVFAPVFEFGTSGVPLFFLLSGYIIWHNYGSARLLRSPREPVRFLWRRFARLWPVNVVSQLLAIPLMLWAVFVHDLWGNPIPDWYSVPGWLGSAFMVGGLLHSEPTFPWNQPSWTLSAEMVAYVLFPLIVLVALTIKATRLRWMCFPLAVALAASTSYITVSYPYRWLGDLAITFVAGVLLRVAGRPTFGPRIMSIVQIGVPIAILAACYIPGNYAAIAPLLAVWVWSLAAPSGALVRLFTTKPMQIAGLSSYSVYMLHWVIFGYAALAVSYFPLSGFAEALYVLFTLVLVGALSWASWRYLETPGRRALNLAFERVWPGRGKLTASEEILERDAGVEPHHHGHHRADPDAEPADTPDPVAVASTSRHA